MASDSQHLGLDEQLDRYLKLASATRRNAVPWRQFAAAAGATLGAASSAEAVIVSMTPTSPIRLDVPTLASGQASASTMASTEFDLDGDAVIDFKLSVFNQRASISVSSAGFYRSVFLSPPNNAEIAGGATSTTSGSFSSSTAYRLGQGVNINGSFTFVKGQALMVGQSSFNGGGMRTGTVYPALGEWAPSDDAFAGVRLTIDGNDHYGWIRFKLTEDEIGWVDSVEVLGWAYEDVPNMPIAAGDTGAPSGTPGDFNGDGMVDLADYTVWRDNLGADESVLPDGSGDNSGTVDVGDYNTWKGSFGSPVSQGAITASTQIPEPTTISLGALALGAAGVTALRRRK